jgi:maltokinase
VAELSGYSELAGLVAAADPTTLAPAQYEGRLVDGPLQLVDALAVNDSLWVGVLRAASGELLAAPLHVRGGDGRSDLVRRAVPGDAAAAAVTDLLRTHEAQFSGSSAGQFAVTSIRAEPVGPQAVERAMDVDQTHESVVVGERAVVKWAVAAEPTPAVTLVAHLTEAGFTEMATPWGFVTWRSLTADGAAEPHELLLTSVTGFLDGASDGWTWVVADAASHSTGNASLVETTAAMASLGAMTADLHAALSSSTSVIAEPRQRASEAEVRDWRRMAEALLAEALREVDGDEGKRLQESVGQIESVFAALDHVEEPVTIPIHGDLHVGQFLRWEEGYAVGDFDGNPVIPVAARLTPQPAARDIAGMVQSIDHVGRVVNRRVSGADARRTAAWIAAAQRTFVDAYLSQLTARGASDLYDDRLLMPFSVEQECREFVYAIRHLPQWRYVPDQALQALFAHDASASPAAK